jgi:type VI secretion system protein ImpI
MTLRLSIENVDRLPDGGPLRIQVKGRGLDLGRDAHLDWTLPDPSRSISSKHCEIRFRDGGYWLHDISTNGTFVNGAQYRLDAPYLLRDGDRLNIGPYVIAVSVDGQQAPGRNDVANRGALVSPDGAPADVWDPVGAAAEPEGRDGYQTRKEQDLPPDFLDHAAYLEPARPSPELAAASPNVDDWLAVAAASRSPAPMAQDMPAPRRPVPARPADDETLPHTAAQVSPGQTPAPTPGQDGELIARIARAAGIPARALANRDPDALADEIGAVIRLTAENLAQMLFSRAESKTLMRSSSRTMIRALENNPLKFGSSTEEALAIMFGPRTRQYLDAQATIERSFADLKAHQILTYGAMQGALHALFEDLAPDRIDHSVEPDRGLGGIVLSRKSKLWDVYVERWRSKTKRADGRLFDAFMALFAEAYDRLQSKGS